MSARSSVAYRRYLRRHPLHVLGYVVSGFVGSGAIYTVQEEVFPESAPATVVRVVLILVVIPLLHELILRRPSRRVDGENGTGASEAD